MLVPKFEDSRCGACWKFRWQIVCLTGGSLAVCLGIAKVRQLRENIAGRKERQGKAVGKRRN